MSFVSINLKKDVVLIKIDDDAPQRKILSELNKKYQTSSTEADVYAWCISNKVTIFRSLSLI